MTPDDIAKGIPDEDAFSDSTKVVRTIRHDHNFRFSDLARIFQELKSDPNLYACPVSGEDSRSDEDVIAVYRSEEGELTYEELVHELRMYLGY
jgi:hypothetical protein